MHARSLTGRFLASSSLITLAVAASAPEVLANPKGGNVVAGEASILDRGNGNLEIRQASSKAVIDWRSFSIGQQEHTHFRQPGRDAVALNRVTGKASSTIAGRLSADGQVILLNPNGILFTKSAQVDVAGLIASTSRLDTQDFMADRYRFTPSGNPDAKVVNRGSITVRDGGLAALVSPWVENGGVITARFGRVALASGEAFTADLWGDGLIQLDVAEGVHIQGVSHTGTIHAEGGVVALSVAEASGLVDRAINLDGVIEATRVAQVGGRVILEGGDGGSVQVAGTLDASGQELTDTGGEMTIAAGRIELASTAKIDVSGPAGGGEARIGGAFQGAPPIPRAKPAREVMVAEGAAIDADAKQQGEGGTIIAWAEETTRFAGTATARGGPDGGNGGLVETSAKQSLDVTGAVVNASAPNGTAGTWLLDPQDVVIVDRLPETPSSTLIAAGSIEDVLNDGTNVTIRTTGASEPADQLSCDPPSCLPSPNGAEDEPGEILVQAGITKTSGPDTTLALIADEDINVFAPIEDQTPSGRLSVELLAGDDIRVLEDDELASGRIDVGGSISLRSEGGPNSEAGCCIFLDRNALQADGPITIEVIQPLGAPVKAVSLADSALTSRGDISISTLEGRIETVPDLVVGENDVAAIGSNNNDAEVAEVSVGGNLTLAAMNIGQSRDLGGTTVGGILSVTSADPTGTLAVMNRGGRAAVAEAGPPAFDRVEVQLTGNDQGVFIDLAGNERIGASADGPLFVDAIDTATTDRSVVLSTDLDVELGRGDVATGSGSFSLTSTGGAIRAGNFGPGGVAHIQTSGDVSLIAARGIGNFDITLLTEAPLISATNTGTGGIFISNTGNLVLAVEKRGLGGIVDIRARSDGSGPGDLTVTRLSAPGSDVFLAAPDGRLTFADGLNPGTGQPLGSVDFTARSMVLPSITTARVGDASGDPTGDQTYSATLPSTITLTGDYTTGGGDFVADDAVRLRGRLIEIDTRGPEQNGQITFLSAIDGRRAGANDLTLRSGDGGIEVAGGIGGTMPLGTFTIDTSFAPTAPVVQNVRGTAGTAIPLQVGFAADAVRPTGKPELLIAGLPPGSVLSDGVNRFTASAGIAAVNVFDWNLAALTFTPPPGTTASRFDLSAQIRGVDANQVMLPDPPAQAFAVAAFEPDASALVPFRVVTKEPPVSTDPGPTSKTQERGTDFAIPNARPARLPDITPIIPSAAQIQPQIAQLQSQIEPAGPDESEESKAAREQIAELQEALAATYDPWEACPEVGTVSTAWQNTPADAAFNYDPAMLPYSVDVYCGGYQLTGPARGAVQDYSGLSFVTRDFWTDRRQAVSPELLQELKDAFGLAGPTVAP